MNTAVRNAKAVIGVDEVHLYKHQNGVEPVINQTLLDDSSTAWFSVATIRDSVEISQEDLSKTSIFIDQKTAPIAILTEPGDFNVTFDMPGQLHADFAKWLEGDSASSVAIGGRDGYGYNLTDALTGYVLVIKTKTGETYLYPNVQGAVTLTKGDNSVQVLRFNGSVLSASNAANKDVYVFSDATSTNQASTNH